MLKNILKFIKAHLWIIILIVVLLLAIGYGIKKYLDSRDKAAADDNRNDIAQQFTPLLSPTDQPATNTPGSQNKDIRGPAPAGNPPADQPPQTVPQTPQTPPQFIPYRNDALGFSTMIPADAQIRMSHNEATAISANQVAPYWTITMYPNTTETLSSIETQLRGSPSVSTLYRTTLGGNEALQFSSPELGGTGYATVTNGRLYYLVGNFSHSSILRDFKFN